MSLSVNDSLQNNSPKPLDNKYGIFSGGAFAAYTSVAQANSSIPSSYRSLGLTVLVNNGSVNQEYWYQAGIADGNLVPKSATATVTTPLTISGSVIGIQVANASQPGYLASTDWNTFNSKISGVSSTGSGTALYASTTSGTAYIKSITAGTGISFTDSGTTITINGGTVGAVNMGTGAGVFSGLSGTNLIQMRSIIGGSGLTATQNTNDITLTINNQFTNTITTTNATPTTAITLTIEDSSAGIAEFTIVGVLPGAANNCITGRKFVQYYKQGGVLAISNGPGDIISDTLSGSISTASWTIAVDGSNNLIATVTGQASTTISWTAKATKTLGQ